MCSANNVVKVLVLSRIEWNAWNVGHILKWILISVGASNGGGCSGCVGTES